MKSKTGSKYKDLIVERNLEYVRNIISELPCWANDYYVDRRPSQSSNTMKSYVYVFKEFLSFLCNSIPEYSALTISELSIEELRKVNISCAKKYLSYLTDKKLEVNTMKAHFSALINLWDYFVESKNFEGNPFKSVKLPKKGKASPIYLRKEENEQFYDTVLTGEGISERIENYRRKQNSGFRDYLICHILGLTGIRVSELVGLDVNDIDLEHKVMKIVLKGTSRTDNTTNIYLSDDIVEEIRTYILEERPLLQPDKNEQALFLVSQGKYKGERLGVRSVEKLVKKYAQAAGIMDAKDFTPHKLRHTFGVNALRNTGNMELVRRLMHHSDVSTTGIYAQSEEDAVMEAREAGKW